MTRVIRASGPQEAKVMLVGDWPSTDDESRGELFSGVSGLELTKMLHEAGLIRTECRITSLCQTRPDPRTVSIIQEKAEAINKFRGQFMSSLLRLEQEIDEVQPNVVVALGPVALWALTGETSISNWRGSEIPYRGRKLIPIYHPATIQKAWSFRPVTVQDLRKVKRESTSPFLTPPNHNIEIFPSHNRVVSYLTDLIHRADMGEHLRLSVDIETIRRAISCVGVATSPSEALVIPVRTKEEFWSESELLQICTLFRRLTTHPNVGCFGQNFSYDMQYFIFEWLTWPNVCDDTMVMQHICYPGTPKKLYYLASLYCEHYCYWKDDLKDYHKAPEDDTKYFTYNGRDVCYTYEVRNTLDKVIDALKLREQYNERMVLHDSLLKMTTRGCRIDRAAKKQLSIDLLQASIAREQWVESIVGYFPNPRSSKQMQQFLYEDLNLPVQYNRKGKRKEDGSLPVSANFECLQKLSESHPLVWPITNAFLELRSLGVFRETFVESELDPDQRMRSYFNPAGPETFRLSSSTNSFGRGMNLQNIPSGNRKKTLLQMPNVKEIFIPDPGKTIADVDLAGADAQVVAWESDDTSLKQVFREKIKVHTVNAKDIFGPDAGPDGKREPYYTYAKMGVHATNYGAYPKTVAAALGITIKAAEAFQKRWFEIHPRIREWQKRTEHLLMTKRMAINKFGYRIIFFDRIEGLLGQALAWVPQSTIAIVSLRGLSRIENDPSLRAVELLIQVHDSLVFQFPTEQRSTLLPLVRDALIVPIPYDDPLIIDYGLKLSTKSWGHCEDAKWE